MKKRILALIIVTAMVTTFVGCSEKPQEEINSQSSIESSEEGSTESGEESSTESGEESSAEGSEESSTEGSEESSVESSEDTSMFSTAYLLGLPEETSNLLAYQYEVMCGGFLTHEEYLRDMKEGFGVTLKQALKITEECGIENLYGVDRVETVEEFYAALEAEGGKIIEPKYVTPTDFQDVYYDCAGEPNLKIQDKGDGIFLVELSVYREVGLGVFEAHVEGDKLVFNVDADQIEGSTKFANGVISKRENGSIDVRFNNTGHEYDFVYHFCPTEEFEGNFLTYSDPIK